MAQQQPGIPAMQDVNAGVVQNQPIETPIEETPVSGGIQIEAYEPPPGVPAGQYAMPPPPPGGFNKRLYIIVGIAIFILLLLGIGIYFAVRPSNVEQPVVLIYWGLWEEEATMETVIQDYQQQHPLVTVQYSMQSPKEYRQRVQAAIQRGEGPDIFRFHNTWTPMFVNELAPLPANIFPTADYEQTFYPTATEGFKVNGTYVGVPLMIDGLVMLYNATLLDEAGVTVPKTWTEFEEAARQMTVKSPNGQIQIAGAAIGTAENVEHFSDIVGLMLYQNNANPNAVKFPSLTSEQAVQALTYYTLFAQAPNNVWDGTQDNSIVAFASGSVAFIFAPTWEVFTIKAMNPDLAFGAAAVPQLEGANIVNWASYWVEGISAKSPHKVAAAEFLKYLSSKEVVTKLFAESSKTRAFGNPYARVDLAEQMKQNNYLAVIAEEAPTMRSWYLASRTQGAGINDRIIAYFRNAVNAIYVGSSASGELQTVSSGVTQVLTEYGVPAP